MADSANHRIQAFEAQGHLLANYGSFGSGAGQFNSPQGVVVDNQGCVLVVNRGNNRLAVLGFDGTRFSYLDNFWADLNAPTGVAAGALFRFALFSK